MGFSRQEYWSGLPFPSPEDLPNPGIKPRSPALQADSLPTEPLFNVTFTPVFIRFVIQLSNQVSLGIQWFLQRQMITSGLIITAGWEREEHLLFSH